MTNEEFREEQSKHFYQRYPWVDECTRETVQDWLDNYWDFNTENKTTEVPKAAVKLIDEAKELIFRLLDEVNPNKAERFKSVPVYAVHVPHTKDEYYCKCEESLMAIAGIGYYLKRDWRLMDSTGVLFTEDEIKYWGLEDCNRVQIEW